MTIGAGNRVRPQHRARFIVGLCPAGVKDCPVDIDPDDMDALRMQFPRHALGKTALCELAHGKGCRLREAFDAGRGAREQDGAACPVNRLSAQHVSGCVLVEATIHIATRIRDRTPAVWARCLRNRDKHAVADTLQTGYPVRLIERFGAAPPRSVVGVYAGTNPNNKDAMAVLDLDDCNPAEIVDADEVALMRAVSGTPKLIRSVSINKVPNVFPIASPDPEHVAAARLISARPDFLERVGQALADRFADREEPKEVEKQIYGGFYSAADKHILDEF